MEKSHDPREFIRGIQQILINNTIRIGFLFGAGTSMAAPLTDENGKVLFNEKNKSRPLIPGVHAMTDAIVKCLTEKSHKDAIATIKEELEEAEPDEQKKKAVFMLENIISAIDQKIRVVGKSKLCGLTKQDLKNLRSTFQKEILKIVAVHNREDISLTDSSKLHQDFAEWIQYASRKHAIEVFTTNYDYLFEIGFESKNLSYFDGFVGGYKPFFDPISVENDQLIPQWTRLWKLHGSLGWGYDSQEKRIIRSREINDDSIVIYPSMLKYDDSRKQPYTSYIDRLSTFLKKEDGVLFVCGYSFGDEHINDVMMNALAQSKSSTIIALVFDTELNENSASIKIGKRSNRIMVCGNRHALIGGKFAEWNLKREPAKEDFEFIDHFFDSDAPEPENDKGKGDEKKMVGGNLKLVDFKDFVDFLIELSYPITEPD